MAWKLGKPLITVACNEDMTASDLVGRFLLDKDGQVTCNQCGAKDDEMEPVDFWATQLSFEE